MVLLGCLVAMMRGVMFAREGNNAVFVRKPCPLQPVRSQLREGWPFAGQVCIHFGGYSEARVASIINPLW